MNLTGWIMNNRFTSIFPIGSMVIVGGGSGISICVIHCGFRCTVQILGRNLHSISWMIDLSRKNFSILRRHSHSHGLPSMRTVLSAVRCDNSSTDRQSRSLSRKSRVSSRGNMRKTSGSTCTRPHLERRSASVLCVTCSYRKHVSILTLGISETEESTKNTKTHVSRDSYISRVR